ncbi:hypothetical protein cypCar_00017233 [Cyprinus carpio]|nr:hypothetical protein cypCar_00017233 [Cyprinus carpio]
MPWSRPVSLSVVSTRRRSESEAGDWALMWSGSQGKEDGCPGSELNPPQGDVNAGSDSTWSISSHLRVSRSLFSEMYAWMNEMMHQVKLNEFSLSAVLMEQMREGCRRLFVIDEIRKMELFSRVVRQTLDASSCSILGTIPVPKGKPLALVEEVRSRQDVKIFMVLHHSSFPNKLPSHLKLA